MYRCAALPDSEQVGRDLAVLGCQRLLVGPALLPPSDPGPGLAQQLPRARALQPGHRLHIGLAELLLTGGQLGPVLAHLQHSQASTYSPCPAPAPAAAPPAPGPPSPWQAAPAC